MTRRSAEVDSPHVEDPRPLPLGLLGRRAEEARFEGERRLHPPRILEFGGIAQVRWAIETYGMEGIHRFLRDVGTPSCTGGRSPSGGRHCTRRRGLGQAHQAFGKTTPRTRWLKAVRGMSASTWRAAGRFDLPSLA